MQTLGDYVLLTTAPDGRATYTAPNTRGNLACQLALPAGTVRVTATEAGLECIDAQEADTTVPWADVEAALAADFSADHLMPVPPEVDRRRLLRAAFELHGITRAQVQAALAGDEAALIEFEEAGSFRRDNPLIGTLATGFSLDLAQTDDLFRRAATL